MESFSTSEIVWKAGCSIIEISPSFGPKYFSFQWREKNITPVHYSSYLAKINRVSFGVISDSVTNETKIKNLELTIPARQRLEKINSGEDKLRPSSVI